MQLTITLKPTIGITSGSIIAVVFTRNTDAMDNPSRLYPFNVNSIPASAIIETFVTSAPILTSVPFTTPTLPASPYYGIMLGRSALGNLSDVIPLTAEIFFPSMITSDSDQIGANAPYTMTFP